MTRGAQIAAWQPPTAGVREVLHAYFPDHAYPMHTHDCWTLLIVDEGVVRYDLDRHQHGAMTSLVTLLPPNVPHDGRSVRPEGFRKRVLYLEPGLLGSSTETDLTGVAVDNPGLADPVLRLRVHQLHNALAWKTEDLEAQSRLLLIRERLNQHLRRGLPGRTNVPRASNRPSMARRDRGLASQLRELLDARVQQGISLADAAQLLHSHPTHLVRSFSRQYGMPPHRYLTGRRVDLARRHLLAGVPTAEVATLAGFYDQPHLTRHFQRMLGTSPGRYARTGLLPGQHRSGPERWSTGAHLTAQTGAD
ncbi:MAG TPA: AraC family transcriptional regulator [Kineosporiaceae bacterium]|nr:AraC family transcriptional regulator [Kineosporiaceae bacterium]